MNKAEKYCRLCSKLVKHTVLKNLFDRSNRKILRQVEDITGVKLKNTKSLPTCYCNSCEADLEHACQFRECVLKAQKRFRSVKFKEAKKYPNNIEIVDSELTLAETQILIEALPEDTERVFLQLEGEHELTDEDKFDDEESKLAFKGKSDISTSEDEEFIECSNTFSEEVHIEAIDSMLDEQNEQTEERIKHTKTKSNISTTKQKKEPSIKFICDQCGSYFTCRNYFLTHLRRHAGDKQFQCELCPEKFFINADLSRHMRLHTGERPFPCRYCKRTFIDCSSRVRHERTHTNERPFSCNHCDKSFTTSYVLKNHMLTHTGERSFQCNLCNKAFRRRTHLVTHYRSTMHQQNEMKQLSADGIKQT